MSRLCRVSRELFIHALTDCKEDRFAKTFRAKADMMNLWGNCCGIQVGRQLAGAITWTITKRDPKMANLQLLHTFAAYRRQGIATRLCRLFLRRIRGRAVYLRVSAEPEAVLFYQSLGMVFLGEQKSGCLLSVGRVRSTFRACVYDLTDSVIAAAVHRKGRGGCVTVYQ